MGARRLIAVFLQLIYIERLAIIKDGRESRGKWTGYGRSNDNESEEGPNKAHSRTKILDFVNSNSEPDPGIKIIRD